MCILALYCLSFSPYPSHASFSDAPPSSLHLPAMLYLQKTGILQGYAGGEARPEQAVTRAEFAKLLLTALQTKTDGAQRCFRDVQTEWFAPYVCTAKNQGIVQGVTATEFLPSRTVTRAEGVVMLLQGFGLTEGLRPVTTSFFSDIQPTDWYAPVMHRAALFNIVDPEPQLQPTKALTRGEAAELIYRAAMIRVLDLDYFDAVPAEQFLEEKLGLSLHTKITPQISATSDVQEELALYATVLEQLQKYHPNGAKVPVKDYVYGSLEGLAKEVGDPYTMFLRPTDSKALTESLNGELVGIGVEIAENAKGAILLNILPGTPAEKAGLLPGDIITVADGLPLAGLDSQTMITKIRGDEGSKLTVIYLRAGQESTLTITRAKLHIPSVEVEQKQDVAVIRVSQFGEATSKELRDALTGMPAGTKGIVLDLRNNGGGYMDIAEDMAGFFLPAGSDVFAVKDAQNRMQVITSTATPLTGLPMMVLINGYSASAAEVVAGALRDDNRATLVGEKSFGKGTIQSLIPFKDGSMLRITIAQWSTPKGFSVGNVNGEHTGLTPDIEVTDDPKTPADEQLDRAIAILLQ